MKITKRQLKRIIKEEINRIKEAPGFDIESHMRKNNGGPTIMKITKRQLKRIIKEEINRIKEAPGFDIESHMRNYAAKRPELTVWEAGQSPWSNDGDVDPTLEILTVGYDDPVEDWQEEAFAALSRTDYDLDKLMIYHAAGSYGIPASAGSADDLLMSLLYPDDWVDERNRRDLHGLAGASAARTKKRK